MQIGVLVGSLRKGSYTRKIANALMEFFPQKYELKFVDLDLPLYNQDFDDGGNVPKSWINFRKIIEACDGFLFITPEYNRSIPAVIKNALDIASRPYGNSAWGVGKKGAVISVTPGKLGGFGANHALRQAMVFLDIIMMQQPEMYIGDVLSSIDDNGEVVSPVKEFLRSFVDKYIVFVDD